MKIISCNCVHPHQDKLYGAGRRAHNATRKSNGTVFRCTACASENASKGEAATTK